ncbi:MAG: GNAT family N-acetyltransferase [Pseudomonadota bacterium]
MTVKVRNAAPADIKAVLRMVDAHNAFGGLPVGRLDAKTFRAAIFGKNAFVFCDLAESREEAGDGPIGYALSYDCFTTDDGTRGLYVADLFVEEAWRREGAGSALMGAVAKRARKRGATHLWWTSQNKNYQARRFYRILNATDQPVHAHAVDGDALDDLAAMRRR